MLVNMEEDNSRAEYDILGEEIRMLFNKLFDATHTNTTFEERAGYLHERAKHDVIHKKWPANTNTKNSTPTSPYSTLVQKWPAIGKHITNKVHILICKLLQKDKEPADMDR